MQPEEKDAAYLWDMLQAAKEARDFIRGKILEDYMNDLVLQAAIERKVEIIGEAARKVSDDFKDAHPEIPWRPIVAQRHVLAHEYGEISQENIWRVATLRIPELIAALAPLIPD
jgi:uncharacterized protein with HEPN domain